VQAALCPFDKGVAARDCVDAGPTPTRSSKFRKKFTHPYSFAGTPGWVLSYLSLANCYFR
jgi:hypothetical protein